MSILDQIPKIGSTWIHVPTGNYYVVYDVTNLTSENLDRYPVRVSYMRMEDSSKWNVDLSVWVTKDFISQDT